MSFFSKTKKNDQALEFPPAIKQAKQEQTPQPPVEYNDFHRADNVPPIIEPTSSNHKFEQPQMQKNLSQDELNYIIQNLKPAVIDGIINHSLFMTSIAHELERRDVFHDNVVKKCLESLEAKYDITPTQIYRDNIEEARNTLDALNTGIKKQEDVYNSFKEALAKLQQASALDYQNQLNQVTTHILEKFKL